MMLPTQLPLQVTLQDQCHFDNFYPGANQAVVSEIISVLEQTRFASLYLWGPAHVGKSHCLQAACHRAAHSGQRVCYLPLAKLPDASPELLDGLEAMDLVCLDDLQTIAGQANWEKALFGFYNALRDGQRKFLVAASLPISQLGIQLPDLQSRLQWESVLRLNALNDDDKFSALQLRCKNRGVVLSEESGRYLMSRYSRDMAKLYGFVDDLIAIAIEKQRRLTIPFIREQLVADSVN